MSQVETEVEANEQQDLWPELDNNRSDHKELMKRARKFAKGKVERDELLKTNKEEVDGLMEKVVEAMHQCGLKKFKHEGICVEIITGKEKVKLKIDTDEDEEEEDSE